MVSFLTACSLEKDTIFGAAQEIFGPSYLVRALVHWEYSFFEIHIPAKGQLTSKENFAVFNSSKK